MVNVLDIPFRSLESANPETRKDDILRAAITAFVGVSNPTKRDCNQIEDLVLSILPFTSETTRRFAAAALCDKIQAPLALVQRLCDEPSEICAPLLLRSPVLNPADLVAIIARHGRDHARIIAKRNHLPNVVIEALAVMDDVETRERAANGGASADDPMLALANIMPVSAEAARQKLREIMGETAPDAVQHAEEFVETSVPAFLPREASRKLTALALKEQEGLFVTAIADMSGLPYARALKLVKRSSPSELSAVLKSFEIDGPTAFLICAAYFPEITKSRTDMRLFLDRHDSMDSDGAAAMVRGWKADEIALIARRNGANAQGTGAASAEFKAS